MATLLDQAARALIAEVCARCIGLKGEECYDHCKFYRLRQAVNSVDKGVAIK